MILVLFAFVGMIILLLIMRHYLVGLTDKRLLVVRVNRPIDGRVIEVLSFPLDKLSEMKIKTFTKRYFYLYSFKRLPFTFITVRYKNQSFFARCHPRFSKTNREQALKISEAIS